MKIKNTKIVAFINSAKKRIIKSWSKNKKEFQWPESVVLFLALFAFISLVLFFYNSIKEDIWEGTSFIISTIEKGGEDNIPAHYIRRRLDGVYVEPNEANLYPVAVMIDNDPNARPQAGLSKAQLVYEAKAESGITRYLAVFVGEEEVDNIGPVRSVRPYFLDWGLGLGAIVAHVGGSPQALAQIINENIFDINEYYQGKYFWRSNNFLAPHNVFTSLSNMRSYLEKHNIKSAEFESWNYKNDSELKDRSENQNITIDFSVPNFKIRWMYNRVENSYRRHQAEKVFQDAEDNFVDAKNIVIMYVDSEVIDAELRRELTTIGQGRAIYCFDGQCREGSWRKENKKTREKIYNREGVEISFNAGATWVEVVQPGTPIEF